MCSSTISSSRCLCGSVSTASRSSTSFHVRALSMTVMAYPRCRCTECTDRGSAEPGQQFGGIERAGRQAQAGVLRAQPLQEDVDGSRHPVLVPEQHDLAVE